MKCGPKVVPSVATRIQAELMGDSHAIHYFVQFSRTVVKSVSVLSAAVEIPFHRTQSFGLRADEIYRIVTCPVAFIDRIAKYRFKEL